MLSAALVQAYEIVQPSENLFGQSSFAPTLEGNAHVTSLLTKKIATKMYRKKLSLQERKLLGIQNSGINQQKQLHDLEKAEIHNAIILKNLQSHDSFLQDLEKQLHPAAQSNPHEASLTLPNQSKKALQEYKKSVKKNTKVVKQAVKKFKGTVTSNQQTPQKTIHHAHQQVLNAQNAFLESLEQ